MKFIVLTAFVLIFSITMTQAQDQADREQTSEMISSFLSRSFPNEAIEKIDVENDSEEMFKVKLSKGSKVVFNNNGAPTEIKSDEGISQEGLPVRVGEYISRNYQNERVVKYLKTSEGHEVKLSNGNNLKFDTDENLTE